MSIAHFYKDPDEKLDYQLDWSEWLGEGETVSTSVWTVPSGLTKESDSAGSDTTTVWLSGGTAGTSYEVSCKITTTGSRIAERTIVIQVEER